MPPGHRENPLGPPLRKGVGEPGDPPCPAKKPETMYSLTPSRVRNVDLEIPQSVGGVFYPNTHKVTPQEFRGREARKNKPPLATEQGSKMVGVTRNTSPQEQGHQRLDSPRSRGAVRRDPPREIEPTTISKYKEVQDQHPRPDQ